MPVPVVNYLLHGHPTGQALSRHYVSPWRFPDDLRHSWLLWKYYK